MNYFDSASGLGVLLVFLEIRFGSFSPTPEWRDRRNLAGTLGCSHSTSELKMKNSRRWKLLIIIHKRNWLSPLLYITNSRRTGTLWLKADDVPFGSIFPRFNCTNWITIVKFNTFMNSKFCSFSPSAATALFGMFPSHDNCSLRPMKCHYHLHFRLRRSFQVAVFYIYACVEVESWEFA